MPHTHTYNQQSDKVGTNIILILQMRKTGTQKD